ncbi:MAG: menaquinone biosynthetic enzyme MqnA/MqnD family protein [Blastocatellia bacterium]
MNMRIAASTYLNSAPLTFSFSHGKLRDRYSFIGDAAPSRCAVMLAARQCEIALIPVIEYQRIPDLRIIPEIAVAAKDRVRSVLIASRLPLDRVRRLALDTSSRTSQALVKILFAERFGRLPEFTERTPDPGVECENMLEANDAALVIGDPAMRMAASAERLGIRIYDLAEEWHAMTGLPFVFAVWAVRAGAGADAQSLVHDFLEAKREGIGQIEAIASQYAGELGLKRQDLISYLRNNVNFDLDDENVAGLRQFFKLARDHGLISEARELRFVLEPRAAIGVCK